MKMLIASILGVVLLAGCAAEKTHEVPPGTVASATTDTVQPTEAVASIGNESTTTGSAVSTATNENHESGTWTGQVKIAQPVSMFNYVGVESGDFAPIRFRNDSDVGRKILGACSNDDMCEFTGVVEWLDETPPPDASAIGQIVRVDSAKRLPATP
jgi:hypothetical protein